MSMKIDAGLFSQNAQTWNNNPKQSPAVNFSTPIKDTVQFSSKNPGGNKKAGLGFCGFFIPSHPSSAEIEKLKEKIINGLRRESDDQITHEDLTDIATGLGNTRGRVLTQNPSLREEIDVVIERERVPEEDPIRMLYEEAKAKHTKQ